MFTCCKVLFTPKQLKDFLHSTTNRWCWSSISTHQISIIIIIIPCLCMRCIRVFFEEKNAFHPQLPLINGQDWLTGESEKLDENCFFQCISLCSSVFQAPHLLTMQTLLSVYLCCALFIAIFFPLHSHRQMLYNVVEPEIAALHNWLQKIFLWNICLYLTKGPQSE